MELNVINSVFPRGVGIELVYTKQTEKNVGNEK
jgi:hypothetical protein